MSDSNGAAALRLHAYLVGIHWRDCGLVGPDTGIRYNYRIGRFVKSYLRWLPWSDDLYYLQAQGYWILANWLIAGFGRGEEARSIAVASSDRVLDEQRDDGSWGYPNPEWRGRVTTYEGVWACLGLLETYRRTREPRYLEGALRWHEFAETEIGYQTVGSGRAANYFAGRAGSVLPNASTDVVRFLAEIAEATGDDSLARPSAGLLAFLAEAQRPSGELPYEVAAAAPPRFTHYQCFQYNAFECLGLLRYLELTGDRTAAPIVVRELEYLSTGVASDGSALYQCGRSHRNVTYHAAALAAAFSRATDAGFHGYEHLAERGYAHVRSLQRADGSFPHSRGDYLLLSDRRAYPRNLVMILFHLLAQPT